MLIYLCPSKFVLSNRLSVAFYGMRRFLCNGDECLCCVRLRYRLFFSAFFESSVSVRIIALSI